MKKTIIFMIILVLLISSVSFMYLYHTDSVCAHESNISFDMSEGRLTQIKGKPASRYKNKEFQELKLTYGDVPLFGYPANAEYLFHKSFFSWRLYNVHYWVQGLDVDQAKQLFYDLYEANTNLYSSREHYFCEEIVDELETKGDISVTFGTNDGATGVYVSIEYIDGNFHFQATWSH